MKVQTVALFIAFCTASVYGQVKQGAAAPAEPAGPPAAVTDAVQKLQSEVQQMKSAGNIDQAKIIQHVQNIADAAKASYTNPSPAVQDQIKTIQTTIDQVKAAGKADPQQISTIIQSIYALTGGKPKAGGKGPAKLG